MAANQYTSKFNFNSNKDRRAIKKIMKLGKIENRIALRARILWLRNQGKHQTVVAIILCIARGTVQNVEYRYKREGISGLYDKPGRGRKPSFSP